MHVCTQLYTNMHGYIDANPSIDVSVCVCVCVRAIRPATQQHNHIAQTGACNNLPFYLHHHHRNTKHPTCLWPIIFNCNQKVSLYTRWSQKLDSL